MARDLLLLCRNFVRYNERKSLILPESDTRRRASYLPGQSRASVLTVLWVRLRGSACDHRSSHGRSRQRAIRRKHEWVRDNNNNKFVSGKRRLMANWIGLPARFAREHCQRGGIIQKLFGDIMADFHHVALSRRNQTVNRWKGHSDDLTLYAYCM